MKCLPIDDALEKYYTQISNITLELQKPENNYIELFIFMDLYLFKSL